MIEELKWLYKRLDELDLSDEVAMSHMEDALANLDEVIACEQIHKNRIAEEEDPHGIGDLRFDELQEERAEK